MVNKNWILSQIFSKILLRDTGLLRLLMADQMGPLIILSITLTYQVIMLFTEVLVPVKMYRNTSE